MNRGRQSQSDSENVRAIRKWLKKVPFLVATKRFVLGPGQPPVNSTPLNLLEIFPAFAPNSDGGYAEKAAITVGTINNVFPSLRSLLESLSVPVAAVTDIEAFPTSDDDRLAAEDLKQCLDRCGSDKAAYHNYHFLYGPILKDRAGISAVFEIGLGTNDTGVVSHMGSAGRPGASLRAFRDFLERAKIYGADIDRNILFSEDRIETFFVDQKRPETFEMLTSVPDELDLFIDDGLHSPDANIESLRFGLRKIRAGGWAVIEDIAPRAVPIWETVSALLPDRYKAHLLSAKGGFVFAVQRLR